MKTCIAERLVYRADFAFSTLVRFLPVVTQVFLWSAIYGIGTPNAQQSIQGYSYSHMVVYYLLTMVCRAFSSMPGLSNGIATDIRDGNVKKYLTQPIDMLGFLFWHRVAHKLVYYVVAIAPFALVFFLYRSHFDGWPPLLTFLGFVASLILSFFIGFLTEALLGLIAFWFLEVSSLMFIYMMFNYFLSGHMIPLDLFPTFLQPVFACTPFPYLAYTPAAIFLGKFSNQQILIELAKALAWTVALFLANRWAFARGVKRYSAYGG